MNYWSQWTKEEIIGDEIYTERNDYYDDDEIEQEEPHCHCKGRGCASCLL